MVRFNTAHFFLISSFFLSPIFLYLIVSIDPTNAGWGLLTDQYTKLLLIFYPVVIGGLPLIYFLTKKIRFKQLFFILFVFILSVIIFILILDHLSVSQYRDTYLSRWLIFLSSFFTSKIEIEQFSTLKVDSKEIKIK